MSEPRVAVVTGAARGIGAAVVRRLATTGWQVVAVDCCADDPAVGYRLGTEEQLTALVREHPEHVVHTVADVQDSESLREAVFLAERDFGGLDAAVGAAALMAGGKPFWEADDSEWDTLFSTGVTGVANLARTAIPALLRRPQPRTGRFVALASAAAHRGLLEPDEVAAAVCFLCSAEASAVTGTVIHADGGFTA